VGRRTLKAGGKNRFERIAHGEAIERGRISVEEVTRCNEGSAGFGTGTVGEGNGEDANFGSTNMRIVEKIDEVLEETIFLAVDCTDVESGGGEMGRIRERTEEEAEAVAECAGVVKDGKEGMSGGAEVAEEFI
jgi:hypothetical protein